MNLVYHSNKRLGQCTELNNTLMFNEHLTECKSTLRDVQVLQLGVAMRHLRISGQRMYIWPVLAMFNAVTLSPAMAQ